MAALNLDVIKEVPGYKLILKAVMKSQIQQLVEQLHSATNEESIILTASVHDGTLSHLGSDSAKGFLEDHEDVKSQFLGYCLKMKHQKELQLAEEAKKRAQQEAQASYPTAHPSSFNPYTSSYGSRTPGAVTTNVGPLRGARPVGLTTTHGVRHSPYSANSPRKRLPSSTTSTSQGGVDKVKTEPGASPFSDMAGDSVGSEDNSDGNQEGLGLGAEFSNFQGDSDSGVGGGGGGGVSGSAARVKTEQGEEEDGEELEIVGVEPGRLQIAEAAALSHMDHDALNSSRANQPLPAGKECPVCHKILNSPSALQIHMRIHTGDKPFSCSVCGKQFNHKGNLKAHLIVHMKM